MKHFPPLLNNSRKTELRRLPAFRQFLISLGAAGPFALLNNSCKTELQRLPAFRQFLISFGAARPFALLIACVIPALGQTHTPLGLSCTIVDTAPKLVRLEGIAELTSDIVLECQGGTPTPAGQPIPSVTFRAYLNTNITSRLLATSPDLSEALLLIDEPAPQIQRVCPKLPCSILADPNGSYNGAFGHYNTFQATQFGQNAIIWSDVPVDPPGPGRIRTLRITNVRANVINLSSGFGFSPVVYVDASGTISIPIRIPQITIGFVQTGLKFSTTAAAVPIRTPINAIRPMTDFTMTFTEGFADAFKPRTVATHPEDTSTNANQNIPGKVFASASGFYNATFQGTYAEAGLATQGTRLIAHFENVPTGVLLYVTEKPIDVSDSLRLQMVSTGPLGDGPYHPVSSGTNGFVPITVYQNSAIAVWEVLEASPTSLESVDFGVAVMFSQNIINSGDTSVISTTTVRGSFAPLSRVAFASLTDPVPRFAEGAPRLAFTLTDVGPPRVNTMVNAATFASDAPMSPGSVAAIFGTNLTLNPEAGSSGPVLTRGGTVVTINDIVAPIYATTLRQVNVQIPWELAGVTDAGLIVTVDGQKSPPIAIKLAPTAPYIFVAGGLPLITRQLPARTGSLTIYGTGFGPVNNQPATGSLTPAFTSSTLTTPIVLLSGVPVEVTFSGLAPGLVGVWQVIVKLREDLPYAPSVPLKLSFDGIDANPVSISLL